MFGMGPTEIIIIAGLALLIFGPKKVPELAKGLGKGLRDFKKAVEGEDDVPAIEKPKDVTPEVEEKKAEPETEPRTK